MDVTVNHLTELAEYELAHVLDAEHDIVELNFVLGFHDSLCNVLSEISNMFEIVSTVTHLFCDEATIALDQFGAAAVIGSDDAPHVLGVEPT
jgi:hypothetical protein